jgi:hypothetical protein
MNFDFVIVLMLIHARRLSIAITSMSTSMSGDLL